MKIQLDITGAGPKRCIATTLDKGCCPYLRRSNYGMMWTCQIFHENEQLKESKDDGSGCLLRWPECMIAEAANMLTSMEAE